jgi:hypothetical protein
MLADRLKNIIVNAVGNEQLAESPECFFTDMAVIFFQAIKVQGLAKQLIEVESLNGLLITQVEMLLKYCKPNDGPKLDRGSSIVLAVELNDFIQRNAW